MVWNRSSEAAEYHNVQASISGISSDAEENLSFVEMFLSRSQSQWLFGDSLCHGNG